MLACIFNTALESYLIFVLRDQGMDFPGSGLVGPLSYEHLQMSLGCTVSLARGSHLVYVEE